MPPAMARGEPLEAARRTSALAPNLPVQRHTGMAKMDMRLRAGLALLLAILAASTLLAPRAAGAEGLMGALYVTTDPSEAAVYVNSELKGLSPCGVADVGSGEVEVKAEKQGYASAIQTVKVEGEKTTNVALSLRRLPNVGSIAVLVEPPGAAIEMDRVPAGRTPTVVLNVAAGTHRVTVSAAGYRPKYVTLTVAPNQQAIVAGRLETEQAAAGPFRSGQDLETLGRLDKDHIPSPGDLPEEQAFDGVRKLVDERNYAEALRRLDEMAASPGAQKYSERIGSERRVIKRLDEVVSAAYEALQQAQGREYALLLRKGIRMEGKLHDVTATHVVVEADGAETQIPLSNIGAEQIVRLASSKFDLADPANCVAFALLYAAEGEFTAAYDQLRAAARAGYDITEARSYVDAEHLWAAAVEKDAAERVRARAAGLGAPQRLTYSGSPVPVLVDTYHGQDPPAELVAAIPEGGFTMRQLTGSFAQDDAREPGVLVVCDAGEGKPAPAYDRQELQSILDFVRRGGGLVFVGTPRPVPSGGRRSGEPPPQHPFAALLRWFGIAVRLDVMSVEDKAPREYPREYALSFPAAAHAITHGVRKVVFSISSPSLAVEDSGWVVVRATSLVGSKLAHEAAPAMVAARTLGEGRVVVFADMPVPGKSPLPEAPLSGNDADVLLRNAMLWVSDQIRVRQASGQ